MASGWSPPTFSDPAGALAFFRDHGTVLRAAVFAGALNLVFTTILVLSIIVRCWTGIALWRSRSADHGSA